MLYVIKPHRWGFLDSGFYKSWSDGIIQEFSVDATLARFCVEFDFKNKVKVNLTM